VAAAAAAVAVKEAHDARKGSTAAAARAGDCDQVQSFNQARLKKHFSRELNNINDYANKAETPTMSGKGGVTLAVLQNIKTLLLRLRLMRRRRRRRRFHHRWISYGN
jgi:hypothetical protein